MFHNQQQGKYINMERRGAWDGARKVERNEDGLKAKEARKNMNLIKIHLPSKVNLG